MPITYNRQRYFTTQESPSPMASLASSPSFSLLAVPPQRKRKQDDFGLIAPILAARKRTVKDAIKARMDIYRYAATMLAVPKYSICCEPPDRTGLRRSAYYSTIELPEFGIKVEGRGSTLPEADCLASMEFHKAMSRCRDRASLAAKKNIFDFNATAKVSSISHVQATLSWPPLPPLCLHDLMSLTCYVFRNSSNSSNSMS